LTTVFFAVANRAFFHKVFTRLGLYLCCYFNATSHVQVATSKKLPDWSFNRVVFPGQRLLFEAPSDAYLEIQTSHVDVDSVKQLLPIKCDRLRVDDGREQ
jgi:hypothetical protein